MYIVWNFSVRKICLFSSHACMHSIIYLYKHQLMDIYFIVWVIIQYYVPILLLKYFQLWPLGLFLRWLLCPCSCSKFILYFPCLSPGNDHFSQESWFFKLQNVIQKPLCTHCCWSINSRPIQQTELGHTHTDVY